MKYVLAIGLETEIYENPSIDFFLNDNFVGTSELTKNSSAEVQQHKKSDLLSAWDVHKFSNPNRLHNIKVPKNWIVYELDDSEFKKSNTLDIVPKNLKTNNMNGFITKRDKCKIFSVMLMPKDWFSTDGIQKVFSHCDGRNILIDFDSNIGWPEVALDRMTDNIHNGEPVDLLPVYNEPATFNINHDEKLGLYIIENLPDSRVGDYMMPVHAKIQDHIEVGIRDGNTRQETYGRVVEHPQKPFEINDDTTQLTIWVGTKVHLNQIATKYQYNED